MKDYLLLDNPQAIKALGHPLRIELINILSRETANVSRLAQHLNLPHAQVFYHVRELEKHRLVELKETKIVSGIQEKYYSTVAKTFFLGQSLGTLPQEAVTAASQAVQENLRSWRREQELQIDLQQLAQQISQDILKLQPNQRVIISGEGAVLDFCHALAVQCRLAGGEALVQAISLPAVAQMLKEAPEETLPSQPLTQALYQHSDYWLWFNPVAGAETFQDVPHSRLLLAKETEERLLKSYPGKLILINYPLEEYANQYNLNYQDMYDAFWRGLTVSEDELNNQALNIQNQLHPNQTITISSPQGTEVQFRPHPTNKPQIFSQAFAPTRDLMETDLSLPAGELILVPEKDSVQGIAVFPTLELRGQLLGPLTLIIENSIITDISGDGAEIIKERIKAFPEFRIVSALGLGLNPGIKNISLPPILAQRGLGSCQLYLGDNQALGGDIKGTRAWPLSFTCAEIII